MRRFAAALPWTLASFSCFAQVELHTLPDWNAARRSTDLTTKRLVAEVEKLDWIAQCTAWGRELRSGKDSPREAALLLYLTSEQYLTSKDRGHAGARTIDIGMTGCGVLAAKGKPDAVNQTTSSRGTSQQWVYRASRTYVYLESGGGARTGTVTVVQE